MEVRLRYWVRAGLRLRGQRGTISSPVSSFICLMDTNLGFHGAARLASGKHLCRSTVFAAQPYFFKHDLYWLWPKSATYDHRFENNSASRPLSGTQARDRRISS
jgi:hypothetical protein